MKELQTLKSRLSRVRWCNPHQCQRLFTKIFACTVMVLAGTPIALAQTTRVGCDGGSGSDTSTATVTVPSLTHVSNKTVYQDVPQTFTNGSWEHAHHQDVCVPYFELGGDVSPLDEMKRPTITITGYLGHLSQTAFFADPPYRRPRYVKCGRERIDTKGDHYHVCWDRKRKKRSRFYVPVIIIGSGYKPTVNMGWGTSDLVYEGTKPE